MGEKLLQTFLDFAIAVKTVASLQNVLLFRINFRVQFAVDQ